jgi:maltose/maltodextrin transport system permease protein
MGRREPWQVALKWIVAAAVALGALYVVFRVYVAGEPLWAVLVLCVFGLGFFIYLTDIAFAYKYLFPGLAGMVVFVVFPMLYTFQIGFTNYSSQNLLTFERATAYLLEQTAPGEGQAYTFTLHPDGAGFRLKLVPRHDEEDEADAAKKAEFDAATYVSGPLALAKPEPQPELEVVPLKDARWTENEPAPVSEVIKHRAALSKLRLRLPDGTALSYSGLREFAPLQPLWRKNADGSLTLARTGEAYKADHDIGFYVSPSGERALPGFKVGIGFGNYERMVNDANFRGPFFAIFLWTVAFAGLTVLLTLAVGCTLAVVLNWEALAGRSIYRTLLFLPYAVPGFISILVFKGLFNQNFGEINLILDALFGIKPAWFADPMLAKVMILIVNTWLGYPYIMVLCTGLIKAIPSDLYEASAIAGAGPLTNFFKITAPLIVRPLTPLLISSFAFNFNNFVLIWLLTGGRPDFLNTKVPAGTTDILVSYTYRIAFQDSGQNFGLAAAISTVIFFLVALLSIANLRLTKVNRQEGR